MPIHVLLIIPCAGAYQFTFARIGHQRVAFRYVAFGKEVHTVAGTVVQGSIQSAVPLFALTIGASEVAAPALTGLADCLQSDD